MKENTAKVISYAITTLTVLTVILKPTWTPLAATISIVIILLLRKSVAREKRAEIAALIGISAISMAVTFSPALLSPIS